MTTKRALEILIAHNKWRNGADIPMQEPALLTVALNKVIFELSRKIK